MNVFQLFTFHEAMLIISTSLLMLSGMSVIFFHVKGWHQKMEVIIWGQESINLGLAGNCQKMGQWVLYCIFPFEARRDQVDKEIARVPLKFKICVHWYFWTGLTGVFLLVFFVPSSMWRNGSS